jgi:hypothetical protein
MRPSSLKHEFVEYIPAKIDEGVLYISIPYATLAHRCCCGCGSEVVTPLGPTDWTLLFDGETVSLDPSIGSWNLRCKSHYWIRNNRVEWARTWSKKEIEAGRAMDRHAKKRLFESPSPAETDKIAQPASGSVPAPSRKSLWRRIRERW